MDDFITFLTKFWISFQTAIAAFVMAFLMAILRTYQTTGRADMLESIMCGLFAVGIWTFLDWLSIPQMVAVGLASAIGYFGTHVVSDFIKRKVDKL
ncbi:MULTISPECIES: phage holin family protein [Acinetobacter]|uniref:phage holin family protein n=1 Tax=Acinetobacter TaxID=469 RepID=UPI001FEBD6EC|nr:phage holin family protein [Acinetobacter populi]MCH4247580.1 phage holin family protein [Acinetobacter populi]